MVTPHRYCSSLRDRLRRAKAVMNEYDTVEKPLRVDQEAVYLPRRREASAFKPTQVPACRYRPAHDAL